MCDFLGQPSPFQHFKISFLYTGYVLHMIIYQTKEQASIAYRHKKDKSNYKIFDRCIFISVEDTFHKNVLIKYALLIFVFFECCKL